MHRESIVASPAPSADLAVVIRCGNDYHLIAQDGSVVVMRSPGVPVNLPPHIPVRATGCEYVDAVVASVADDVTDAVRIFAKQVTA